MDSMLGQTLGQYELVEQIGKGGMATVYKAFQRGLNRYVAVKILPAYYAHEPGFAGRFTREAQAIAQLDHPHILPVYDFGKAGDISFITMKYVPAGSLRDRLGRPISPAKAVELIEQIAGALDTAHTQGILHRDVKPGNILIDDRGWLYLSDFGLAKIIEGSVQLTGSGTSVGTPAYMSPEQGQGLAVDARTDVYALGVILFEILTGHVPYEAETPMGVVIKHISAPIPLPRQINANIPEPVEQVVLKSLAKNPAERFASAGEMAAALRRAVEGLETYIAAAPIQPDFEATLPHQVEMQASQTIPPPAPVSRSLSNPGLVASSPVAHPITTKKMAWLPIVVGIAALAMGGSGLLIGWLYLSRGSESSPTPATVGALMVDAPTPQPSATVPVTLTPTHSPSPMATATLQAQLRSEGDQLPQHRAGLPTSTPPPLPTPIAVLPTVSPILQEVGLGVDNFEGVINLADFVINRNAGNEGKVSLAGPPHLKQGQQALALEFDIRYNQPNHYIGFDREFPPQDWSSYSSLCVWVESDGSNRTLVIQFGESKYKFWKSVVSLAMIGVGDTCVALQGEHQIDLRAVGYYGIYVEGPPPGQSVIYLDNIRVVKPAVTTPAPVACSTEPQGIFRNLWFKYKDQLGCPQRVDPLGGFYAEQPFQSGRMVWSKLGQLYLVLIGADQGTWRLFPEDESTWKEGMPPLSCQASPPPHLIQPIRGFGGLWCAYPEIRERIGYGLADERGFEDGIDLIQGFERGIIFRDSDGYSRGLAYVLFEDEMTFVREKY